jgi:hypothetical protein
LRFIFFILIAILHISLVFVYLLQIQTLAKLHNEKLHKCNHQQTSEERAAFIFKVEDEGGIFLQYVGDHLPDR